MDWKRIKADYISGNLSYRKLAEKHGVSFNTLKTRAIEEQWYELRQQNHNKTTTAIVQAINDKDVQTAVDIDSTADKLLEQIVSIVGDCTSPQMLKQLTSALKDIKDIKGHKSEADMREQEARIAKLRKEAEKEDDNTSEIEVIFNAGEEDWNG